MKKIVLIACASKKQAHRAKARNIYISPLFRLNLAYAKSINPDKVFILSAKHFLLDPEMEIDPYNITLNTMKDKEIKLWANNVLYRLKEVSDLEKDEFIFLAGEKYRRHLIPNMTNYKIPLEGLGIGKQLKFLKENTK